jgi:hypothetical protein
MERMEGERVSIKGASGNRVEGRGLVVVFSEAAAQAGGNSRQNIPDAGAKVNPDNPTRGCSV